MYGNKKRAPAPQPKQEPSRPGTGHYWPHYCPSWYDYDYDYDYDQYDNYDDWYDWVWTSAYAKGMGEGRKQGYAHAVKLAEGHVMPTPMPEAVVEPMPEANAAPMHDNVVPINPDLGI